MKAGQWNLTSTTSFLIPRDVLQTCALASNLNKSFRFYLFMRVSISMALFVAHTLHYTRLYYSAFLEKLSLTLHDTRRALRAFISHINPLQRIAPAHVA